MFAVHSTRSASPGRRVRLSLTTGLDWSDQRVRDALRLSARLTTTMMLPLVVSLPLGVVGEGMQVAVAALFVGLADPGGRARVRLLYMGVAAVGVVLAASLATLVGSSAWLSLIVMAVMGFGAGYATVLGPHAAAVGTMVLLKYVFGVVHPGDAAAALDGAGLTAAGAGFALFVQLVLFPSHVRRRAERAVGAFAHNVADYCRAVADRSGDITLTGREHKSLLSARTQAMNARGAEGVDSRLFRLTQQLVELHRNAAAVATMMVEQPQEAWGETKDDLRALAGRVDRFAEALERGLPVATPTPRSPDSAMIADAATPSTRKKTETAADAGGNPRRSAARSAAMELDDARTRLDTAWTEAFGGGEAGRDTPAAAIAVPQDAETAGGMTRPLLENLTPRSFAFRHAVQMSLATAACVVLYEWVLPYLVPWWPPLSQQGYWITLTVVVILKLDVAGIYQRVKERTVGTAIGATLALLVAVTIHDSGVLLLLTIVFAALAFFYFSLRYSTFVVFLTPMVIVMIGILSPGDWQLALARVADTLLGAGLGFLIAMTILPNRERLRFPDEVATLAGAVADYLHEIDDALSGDRSAPNEALREPRMAPALLNAEESYDRLLSEPFTGPDPYGSYGSLLYGFRRLCADCAVLAHIVRTGRAVSLPTETRATVQSAAVAIAAAGDGMKDGVAPSLEDDARASLRRAADDHVSHAVGDLATRTLSIVDTATQLAEDTTREATTDDADAEGRASSAEAAGV